MRRGLACLALSAIAAWGTWTEARAQPIAQCVIHHQPQPEMNQQMLSLFSWFRDAALRECGPENGQKHYAVLTKPKPIRFGICQYAEIAMSSRIDGGQRLHMARPQPVCPEQGEAYVAVLDVPPGVFLSLVRFWDRVAARPVLLDAAPDTVRSLPAFASLKEAIRAREPLWLERIRLHSKADGTLPYYGLSVRGVSLVWDISVDPGPKSIEITGLTSGQ